MEKTNTYPQNSEEWQLAIHEGIGINASEGQKVYQSKNFHYKQLEEWIRNTFSKGFSPEFLFMLIIMIS